MKPLKDHQVINRDTIVFFLASFLYFFNAIFPTQNDDLVMKLSYERFVLKELKQRNMHGVSLSW